MPKIKFWRKKKTQERISHTEAKKQRPKLSQRVIVSEIQRENSHINTRNKKEERIDKGRTPSVDWERKFEIDVLRVRPTDRNTGRCRDRERHKKDPVIIYKIYFKSLSRSRAAVIHRTSWASKWARSERKSDQFRKKNREDPIHLVRKWYSCYIPPHVCKDNTKWNGWCVRLEVEERPWADGLNRPDPGAESARVGECECDPRTTHHIRPCAGFAASSSAE